VKKALEEIGSVAMGKAVITTAGELNAGHIIHACGPKFQEAGMENKLRSCMTSALDVAKQNGLKRVAFPPMGYGFYGVPMPMCIKVMTETIKQHCSNGTSLEEILVVTVDKRDFNAFKENIEKI
jgi:O-acetyl-ADP-ribose deacetylase (regulator of RNase III)